MPIEQNFEATNGRVLRRTDNTNVTFADDNGNTIKVSIATAAFDEMFKRFVTANQENLGNEVQAAFDTVLGNLGNTVSDALGKATADVLTLRKEIGIRTRRNVAVTAESETEVETPEVETPDQLTTPSL